MLTLQEQYEKNFVYLCQEGKISELCVLLIAYSPSVEVIHKGILKAIQLDRGNTVNFILQQFEEVDPHYNDNQFFLEALRKDRYARTKNLITKLVRSKSFDSKNLGSIVTQYLEHNSFVDNRYIRGWNKFAFFKYFPKHIQQAITNNEGNLRLKLLNFFKINEVVKHF